MSKMMTCCRGCIVARHMALALAAETQEDADRGPLCLHCPQLDSTEPWIPPTITQQLHLDCPHQTSLRITGLLLHCSDLYQRFFTFWVNLVLFSHLFQFSPQVPLNPIPHSPISPVTIHHIFFLLLIIKWCTCPYIDIWGGVLIHCVTELKPLGILLLSYISLISHSHLQHYLIKTSCFLQASSTCISFNRHHHLLFV